MRPFAVIVTLLGVAGGAAAHQGAPMTLQLTSPSFLPGGAIPREYTCEGRDVSPALAWSGAPAGTRSFALIVDDPDAPDPAAPKMTWVHWVLYDIPAAVSALPAATTSATLPHGAREGLNDWRQVGWRGPCPPVGRHRYVFKLYALDTLLGDLGEPSKTALERTLAGHVIGHAQLIGTYQKTR